MASYPNGERKSGDVMKVAAVTSQASLDLTASWVVGDRPEDILERVAV
jgi:histidinol phosphatase-like enzyme